jgi:DNA-binding GntR family transcriptional regulator
MPIRNDGWKGAVMDDDDVFMTLNPTIERRGLRDRVYDRVLVLLLSDEIPPGARLSIETIARQLSVSPTPVREALVQLERTGLVTREALKGYRVAPPLTVDQLHQLTTARVMLETTATRLATPADSALLRELGEAFDAHWTAGEHLLQVTAAGQSQLSDTTEYFARDVAFHRVIFRHCDNTYLQHMSETLGGQLHRMRQSALYGDIDVTEALEEHAAILAAFRTDDPEAPARAMRHHIQQVGKRSLETQTRA